MSKKKSAASAVSTPFFARYLEGQVASSAEVRSARGSAYAKAKAKKKAATATPIKVTLKFPSDSDEVTYVPYYQGPKYVPPKYRGPVITLKYPSDSDEYGYVASYLTKADVPKAAVTGAVKAASGKIVLKKKPLKGK